MAKKPIPTDFALNGLSIHNLSVDQGGDLEVEFDLPQEQTNDLWYTYRRGSRTFDIYQDEEMQEACRVLFQIVKKRLAKPDPEKEKVHCDSCEGSPCCRKYSVLTTESDIERLAAGIGMSVEQLKSDHLTEAVDWCGDYEYQVDTDEDDEGEDKCVFLKPNEEGLYRCTVYEHRPEICRAFDMKTCDDFVPIVSVLVL